MGIKPHILLSLGGVALLAVTATGCTTDSEPANSTVESKSFDFSGDSLTVKSNSADLELVGADVQDVQVERQVSGTKVGGKIEPEWQLEGSTLTLSLDCKGISVNCKAKYTVKIPRNVAITAEDDKGLIKATGFTADFSAKAGNSDMQLSDLSGANLDLEGRDGNIEGDRISAKSVTVTSRNGDSNLSLASVPDLADMQSQDGNIKLNLPEAAYAVDAAAKKGDSTVGVTKDDTSDHVVRVHTRNGDIAIGKAS
ncbi:MULTISPECIES: DUF4097 family beta strand repeat-containing protein [unclassified Streptomyces]|uniref:DUF4097 family beta strand repeat-containing protein n=1 Tax=unclassified Streptomyces TaxID=2593676 RepID=UPI002E1E604A|nr:DUF4097 domain-containing protein [Streptomyces sp. NBC_01023]